ncbi:MAG: DUF3604 domain-containing protein, partial [Planctomycetota bacterium]
YWGDTHLHTGMSMDAGAFGARLSPAQLDALHTRRYDAPADATFNATANALIDMGYHIGVTDADGGILAAARRRDPSVAEHALWLTVSTAVTFGRAPMLAPSDYFIMCVLVAPDAHRPRSIVRFETFKNGRLVDEEKRFEELWARIDRRLLTMGSALPDLGADAAADSPTAAD